MSILAKPVSSRPAPPKCRVCRTSKGSGSHWPERDLCHVCGARHYKTQLSEALSKQAAGPELCPPPRLFAIVDWARHAAAGTIPPPEQILSVPEAAAILHKPEASIRTDQRNKRLPIRRRGGGIFLFWQDLVAYLEAGNPGQGQDLADRFWLDYCQKRLALVRFLDGNPSLDSPITFPPHRGDASNDDSYPSHSSHPSNHSHSSYQLLTIHTLRTKGKDPK